MVEKREILEKSKDILQDLVDDFAKVNFYEYQKGDTFEGDFYLFIDGPTNDGRTVAIPWGEIRPYLEECVDRFNDVGLEFKNCRISGFFGTGSKDLKRWKNSNEYIDYIPNEDEISSVTWICVNFSIKRGIVSKGIRKFKDFIKI